MSNNSESKIFVANVACMEDLGKRIAKFCRATSNQGYVIYLQGPLGAGKTTLVRGFMQGLGYRGRVKSPTFGIMEIYEFPELVVVHFDLYRLQHATELSLLGMHDYLNNNTICLIEWPEQGEGCLPKPDLRCNISLVNHSEDERYLNFSAESLHGVDLINHLKASEENK